MQEDIFLYLFMSPCQSGDTPPPPAELINGVSVLSPQWVKLVDKLTHP